MSSSDKFTKLAQTVAAEIQSRLKGGSGADELDSISSLVTSLLVEKKSEIQNALMESSTTKTKGQAVAASDSQAAAASSPSGGSKKKKPLSRRLKEVWTNPQFGGEGRFPAEFAAIKASLGKKSTPTKVLAQLYDDIETSAYNDWVKFIETEHADLVTPARHTWNTNWMHKDLGAHKNGFSEEYQEIRKDEKNFVKAMILLLKKVQSQEGKYEAWQRKFAEEHPDLVPVDPPTKPDAVATAAASAASGLKESNDDDDEVVVSSTDPAPPAAPAGSTKSPKEDGKRAPANDGNGTGKKKKSATANP